MEAIEQETIKAYLQVIEDVFNPRLLEIEWATESLRLSITKIEREVNNKERIAKKKFRVSIVVNSLKISTT